MKWTCPPAATLARDLAIDDARAAMIRAIWRGDTAADAALRANWRGGLVVLERATDARLKALRDGRSFEERRLAAVDVILETHGVELLGRRDSDGAEILYCNAGDSYAATLIATGRTLRVGCWGDYFEPRPRRGVSFFNRHSGDFERAPA